MPYISLKRPLLPLVTLAIDKEGKSNQETDDAIKFLQHIRSSQKKQIDGVLLEGNPYAGKTRLVNEFIKQYAKESYILVPHAKDYKATHSQQILKQLIGKKSVEIILDDIHRFEENLDKISQLINLLLKTKNTIFIWATVRNGSPSQKFQNNDDYRFLRETVKSYVLALPTLEDCQKIATSDSNLLNKNTAIKERSFSFVEYRQLEEMTRRWQFKLSESAKRVMRSAAALDFRGISLLVEGWKHLAKKFGEVDLNLCTSACSKLQQ